MFINVYVMNYISILDYSTDNNLIIEDTDGLTEGMEDEEIGVLLETLGINVSTSLFMVTSEDPGPSRTTLKELADDIYEDLKSKLR